VKSNFQGTPSFPFFISEKDNVNFTHFTRKNEEKGENKTCVLSDFLKTFVDVDANAGIVFLGLNVSYQRGEVFDMFVFLTTIFDFVL